MPKPSLQIITLGCSKNQVDTEHLLGVIGDGWRLIPEEDMEQHADWLLLNTCGFIGDAKEESVNAIFQAVERKRRGLVSKIGVFGCLAQRYSSELPGLIPEVDFWGGARDLRPVAEALGVSWSEGVRVRRRFEGNLPYAYLKISEGCDRHCSYCAIPLIRGAHKSVPIEVLVQEASDLAAQGVKELILIAQDTTFYGLDIYGERALARLLRALSAIDGIEWLRIHYSYPASFPEDVLEEMAVNPKLCKYMDIPLQHISDKVLANMRRGVDGAWTRALVSRMRAKVPGIVLRTTMIVGHPGEGPREFSQLLDFVREARFERLGAFCYSEEEGTYGALNFEDNVSDAVKRRRLQRLMDLQRSISSAWNASRVGTRVKVLADSCLGGRLVCRSEFESPEVDGEIIVSLPEGADPRDYVGRFFDVKIVSAGDYDLEAVLAKTASKTA